MGPVDRETCHEHPFQDQWPFHISARCRYFFCCGSLLFGFALALFDPVSGVAFLFIPPLSWLSIFFAPGLLSAGPGPFAIPRSFSFSIPCSLLRPVLARRFTLLLGLFSS
jgi:hypothetical protein